MNTRTGDSRYRGQPSTYSGVAMYSADHLQRFIRNRLYSADRLQRFIRSRLARVGLAVVLIVLSAWAFLPYVTYRIAPSAFVNAELMRVAAPIAGRLTRDLPRKGDFVDQPVTVSLIKSLSPDRRHLLDLDRQHAVAEEHAALARKQLEEIAAADAELEKRLHAYREGMIKRLGDEIVESEAEKTGCLAEAHQRQDAGSRWEQLVKAGTASQVRSVEAQAVQEATAARCEMAGARRQRLQDELASAQDGVFLRDGANDAPYSQQQRDRLLLRRQELETLVLEGGARSQQLTAEITEERERVDRLAHADLSLPQAHVVWSVSASPGSTVTEGQPLLDLADCARRFVAVELPERDFELIKAGEPAYVRLIGSDDWKQGEVRQVRGSAARADDRLLAAQVPSPNAGSITVEIGLPQDEAETDRNNFCNIGRLAEVRFDRVRFAFFDRLGKALGWNSSRTPPEAVAKPVASQ
jgi:multidrug resistance efflux pump